MAMMTATVRFAPSPTGNIHIGNARTALINWLFAGKHGGRFILRFDDTDRERSKAEFAANILRDLAWLGIRPDRVEHQSLRAAEHAGAAEALQGGGLLYACYETTEELERRRRRQIGRGRPPIYDRAALRLGDDGRAALERQGRRPHWRFLLPNFESDPLAPRRTELRWRDLIRGEQVVDLASMSDPVLVREDGSFPYTLPSVADDIEFGVTHVIRGDDHVANTAVQIALFRALGAEPPQFGHHNLLTLASGEALSKRLGSLSIASLAARGYEPMAVASLAVLIGTSLAVEPCRDLAELGARFDLAAISKSPARFDIGELDALNARLVHALDWPAVADRFPPDAFDGRGEEFWPVVRENLAFAGEARDWWERLVDATPLIAAEDRDFLKQARELLPDGPVTTDTWPRWTAALARASGRKGRALFLPLRQALTGMAHGPEMARLLPLIGRERILARLS